MLAWVRMSSSSAAWLTQRVPLIIAVAESSVSNNTRKNPNGCAAIASRRNVHTPLPLEQCADNVDVNNTGTDTESKAPSTAARRKYTFDGGVIDSRSISHSQQQAINERKKGFLSPMTYSPQLRHCCADRKCLGSNCICVGCACGGAFSLFDDVKVYSCQERGSLVPRSLHARDNTNTSSAW